MANVKFAPGASIKTPSLVMTPDWAQWIATNALAGISGQSMCESMIEAGFDPEVAVAEVQGALTHPFLLAAAKLGVGRPGAAAPTTGGQARADKLAWFLDNSRRLGRMSSSYGEVERVHKPSRQEFLDRFYSQNTPCIITGAIDDWPALTKWDGDYLKERCGDKVVEVQANRESDDDYEVNSEKLKQQMAFSEIVDIIESGVETNDWYITANNSGQNKTALRALWDDIRFPDYLDPDHANDGFFWYGPAGTVTPIHHDLTNNFMAQVRGRKRVKIVAPQDSANVYNDQHCFSPVDMENPDLERFPDWAKVDVIDVELGPGDLFFLPVGWWHHVRGLETSITMTFTNFVYDNDFFSDYTTYGPIG
jgi:hypothetical protein